MLMFADGNFLQLLFMAILVLTIAFLLLRSHRYFTRSASDSSPVVHTARPEANYGRSLELLRCVKRLNPEIVTKSGLMVGLGETKDEILAVLRDLRGVGCDALTIGQYLQPSPAHLPVERFVEPSEFDEYRDAAEEMGFVLVASGPFVRSSYHAGELLGKLKKSGRGS